MAFCASCGSPLTAGVKFCSKCGTAVSTQPAAPAPTAAPLPATSQGSGPLRKILWTILTLILLFILAAMGSCVYIAYRAKKKAEEISQAYKHSDAANIVQAITGKVAGDSTPAKLPDWKLAPPDLASSPAGKVPLRPSLRVIGAVAESLRGDYEAIGQVDSVTDQSVHIRYSAQVQAEADFGALLGQKSQKPRPLRKIACGRTVLRADMENAIEINDWFCGGESEERFPGTTAISISQKLLRELKTNGQADFVFHVSPLQVLFKVFKTIASGSTDASKLPTSLGPPPVRCRLHRVEASDLAFPILINDQPAELPAIHAACKPPDSDQEAHFYFLDDTENPLALGTRDASGTVGQIVKIYWNNESVKPVSQLEQQLEKNGRAQVYGIYFDFSSDVLRPESQTVLDQIAQVMHEHPDWRLGVEGHTDNIGGDAYNLDLSNRRAATVKQALVTRYHIDPDRLSPAGFGATRPVDSNDTLEGRARNRRVELVRE
jgi:outer membrane protein OmpA-like peptidoglycan-associated protein